MCYYASFLADQDSEGLSLERADFPGAPGPTRAIVYATVDPGAGWHSSDPESKG